jgi:NADH-quinone oxidoreductase subunit E
MPGLSEAARSEIRALGARYERRQSALLPALFVAQREAGWLPPDVLEAVAEALEVPLSEVAAVASFYRLYCLRPPGRHQLLLCTNLACLLNGADRLRAHLEARLGVRPGETTPDGLFTFRTWECLAWCDHAPMMMVDEERYGPLTPERVDEVLARYRAGGRPADHPAEPAGRPGPAGRAAAPAARPVAKAAEPDGDAAEGGG